MEERSKVDTDFTPFGHSVWDNVSSQTSKEDADFPRLVSNAKHKKEQPDERNRTWRAPVNQMKFKERLQFLAKQRGAPVGSPPVTGWKPSLRTQPLPLAAASMKYFGKKGELKGTPAISERVSLTPGPGPDASTSTGRATLTPRPGASSSSSGQ